MERERKNNDERMILELAQMIPGISTRYSTAKEDCGYQKADIVLEKGDQKYYLQVSHQPKSKKQQRVLEKRGTYQIHTHNFNDMPISQEEIVQKLKKIIT